MPSRAYVAHDQAVSVVRMYLQMAVIGLIVGTGLYCALMAAFLSHWVSGPIPELREVDGRSRLVITPSSPRLPLSALVKYYVSLNPANYVSTNLNPSRQTVQNRTGAGGKGTPASAPELKGAERPVLPTSSGSSPAVESTSLRWIVPCSSSLLSPVRRPLLSGLPKPEQASLKDALRSRRRHGPLAPNETLVGRRPLRTRKLQNARGQAVAAWRRAPA